MYNHGTSHVHTMLQVLLVLLVTCTIPPTWASDQWNVIVDDPCLENDKHLLFGLTLERTGATFSVTDPNLYVPIKHNRYGTLDISYNLVGSSSVSTHRICLRDDKCGGVSKRLHTNCSSPVPPAQGISTHCFLHEPRHQKSQSVKADVPDKNEELVLHIVIDPNNEHSAYLETQIHLRYTLNTVPSTCHVDYVLVNVITILIVVALLAGLSWCIYSQCTDDDVLVQAKKNDDLTPTVETEVSKYMFNWQYRR